jgi:hypothetical protein
VAMVNNNAPYLGMTVKISRSPSRLCLSLSLSLSVHHSLPQPLLLFGTFLPGGLFTGNSCSPDYGYPCRSDRSHPVRDEISFSRRKYRLPPVLHFWTPSFCTYFWYCRGDAVAMVNNNTPYLGMMVKISRSRSCPPSLSLSVTLSLNLSYYLVPF